MTCILKIRVMILALFKKINKKVWFMYAYLPPPSLQLGQVQATLRSLFPSWCCWSPSSSTTCTLKCVRSLVFNVESPLSCHSSGSGSSSLILISEEKKNKYRWEAAHWPRKNRRSEALSQVKGILGKVKKHLFIEHNHCSLRLHFSKQIFRFYCKYQRISKRNKAIRRAYFFKDSTRVKLQLLNKSNDQSRL